MVQRHRVTSSLSSTEDGFSRQKQGERAHPLVAGHLFPPWESFHVEGFTLVRSFDSGSFFTNTNADNSNLIENMQAMPYREEVAVMPNRRIASFLLYW